MMDDPRPGLRAHDDPDVPWRYEEDCGCVLCLGWERETMELEGPPEEAHLMALGDEASQMLDGLYAPGVR